MTLLLALDTSTAAVTVALHDGSRVVAEQATVDARRTTEALAPAIADVFAEAGATPADLTGVVVGNGPGPFTGLRVGMVTATSVALAVDVPVHGVCSLDALARAALADLPDATELLVATDARRKEVYWARYVVADGRETRLTEPAVDLPATVGAARGGAPVVGRGPVLYPDDLGPAVGPLDVSAGVLAQVALEALERGEELPVEPLYLRRPDALSIAEREARAAEAAAATAERP